MVPSDMIMHLFPQPLNDVVLGRIGRQEVQDDTVTELGYPFLGLPGFMDDVVVQDEVELFRPAVGCHESFQESQKQAGVLAKGFRVDDFARSRIKCSGQISLLILARSQDDHLPPLLHVAGADSGVQIHVGLIDVKDFLPAGAPPDQATDPGQDAPSAPHRDAQAGTRPAPATSHFQEQGADVAGTELDSDFPVDFLGQKFQGPCGPLPAHLPRRFFQQKQKTTKKVSGDFSRLGRETPVCQAILPMFVKAIDGLIDPGAVTAKVSGNLTRREAIIQKEEDLAPGDFNGIPRFMPTALNSMTQSPIKVWSNYIHEREVLLQGLSSFATTQRTQKASLFNTAHPDPTAHLDPYSIANLIPID